MDEDTIVIDTSKLSHDEIQYFIDSFKRSPVLLQQFDKSDRQYFWLIILI